VDLAAGLTTEPEGVEVHTEDGVVLRALLREPAARMVGTAVMAHAMFARSSEFERAGFAAFFASRGWRTVAFDFRAHGDSGGTASPHGYDDLVFRDLPAVVHAARARARQKPVVVVGHSLGGHVAMAAQGVGAMYADAIVGLASNIWLPELEPSLALRATKRAAMKAVLRVVDRAGHYPARALRMGSDDEPAPYMRDLARFTLEGAWRSRDGRHDYLSSLSRVDVPVYAIASDGDWLMARPDCVRRFHAHASGPVEVDRVQRSDDGRRAPGHMGVVTTTACAGAWERGERFLRERL